MNEVIEDVRRLLGTRCMRRIDAGTSKRRTVLDYGLPDYLHLSPTSRLDAIVLAGMVRNTIHSYVPAVIVEKVLIDLPRARRDEVRATISAKVLRRDGSSLPVTFPIHIGG
ncbi:MAG TPA: hypothetical protein VMM36_04270 [Opitutaceae bacterium]|nr:hypothetical protein [Opitutaceae bacterium]